MTAAFDARADAVASGELSDFVNAPCCSAGGPAKPAAKSSVQAVNP
jgi:hypothetical protein